MSVKLHTNYFVLLKIHTNSFACNNVHKFTHKAFYYSTIETASFVPPAPNEIIDYLDEWEKFINSDFDDLLIQLAIVHAQFEIIHPFLDGNGRLGRLLIPIFLYSKEYLSQPIFYLSEYFESHRE